MQYALKTCDSVAHCRAARTGVGRGAPLACIPDDRHCVARRDLFRVWRRAGAHPYARPRHSGDGPADGGSGQNIQLLEAGEIQVGFVTLGIALQAWNGSGSWTGGKQLRAMRALFPMYDTPFQFMAREDTGIRSVGEFNGKRVGVGPQGGTTAAYIPEFFKVLKVDSSLVHGDWADLAAQVQAGTLDALAVAAGVPSRRSSTSNDKAGCDSSRSHRARSSSYVSPCRNSQPRRSEPAPTRP